MVREILNTSKPGNFLIVAGLFVHFEWLKMLIFLCLLDAVENLLLDIKCVLKNF